nr:hypothetical protein [uncultured Mediterranean phage uvMED]
MKLTLYELDNIFISLKCYSRTLPKSHKEEIENLTTRIYNFLNDEKKKINIDIEKAKNDQK